MTVMTRRRDLVIFLLVCLLAAAAIAGIAHTALVRSAVDAAGSAEVKLLSERVLFAGIIGIAVVLIAGFLVILRSVNLSRRLDKLVAMNRMTGFSPEMALKRLGDVGDRIATIYRQVSDLSEKKSRKISSLTALNELLLGVSEQMVLVVDVAGNVLQVSRPLLERVGRSRTEIIGLSLDELIPGASVAAAIREASQTRSAVVRDRRGDSLILNPVINRDGEVAYLVALLTRSVTDDMKRVSVSARPPQQQNARRGFFRRLARRG